MESRGLAGGKALLAQRGHDHFVSIGKKGGRPRLPTIDEVRKNGNGHKVQSKVLKSNNLRVLLKELKEQQNAD